VSQKLPLYSLALTLAMTSGFSFAENTETEKNPEDPTKVITKAGAGFSGDNVTISGSLGLDEARMINATINQDASEWSLGGSWLFDIGILNFNFRKTTYDDDSHNTSYNLGTFVPLSYFDFTPGGWQPFVMGGYSYNDGEIRDHDISVDPNGAVFIPVTSHALYVGAFAFKPWSEHWTTMAFLGTTQGSQDLGIYWAGAGVSYRINKQHSFNLFGMASDSTIYGSEEKLSVNYRYEFNR
jgi:hypothetical protein